MDQREHASPEQQDDVSRTRGPAQDEASGSAPRALNLKPGGKDALGTKENLLAPFYDEMVEVARELAPQFTPLGLHFRPEVLLATAMQEAANKDPLNARSFDNGLGIMQITPYKGKLDEGVAKAIGWDNAKSVEYNIQHSRWREAKPNLLAGAQTMLVKAKAIRNGVSKVWSEMDEPHRWRAVLYAYNAGEGSAIRALKNGGANAKMISSFTDKNGKRVSHDYTAELKAKMDYVDSHDPFQNGGQKDEQPTKPGESDKPTTAEKPGKDPTTPPGKTTGDTKNDPFHVSEGQLTFDAEGTEGGKYHTRKAHWPGGASGVTIGRGYDLGAHGQDQIVADLVKAGVAKADAEKFGAAAGKKGTDAKTWLAAHKDGLVEITPEQQHALFETTYSEHLADVERISGNYAKTKGKDSDKGEAAFQVNFDTVHPAIKDILVDLRYRGDYTPGTRVHVQPPAIANDLPKMAAIMADQQIWSAVPADRFERRKKYMQDALKGKTPDKLEDDGKAPAKDPATDAGGGPDKKPAEAIGSIQRSVGVGGANRESDVRAVQTRLKERGIDPGSIDGDIGPNTIRAIKELQANFMSHPDGLISPGKTTEKHLFGESGKIEPKQPAKEKPKAADQSKDMADHKDEQQGKQNDEENEPQSVAYEAIAKNFNTAIPGSQITWHQALYLPSWGRHAKPSDVTNTSMDTVLANIQKQAAALQKVSDHFGKPIVVHCWLRPPKYNKQIGGAGNSAHLRGMATDFHMEGITAEQVRKVLKANPDLYPGSGENNVSWVHIDLEHHKWFNP